MDHAVPVLLLAVLASCSQHDTGGGTRSGARPDILLITVDTLRADALRCYGRAQARTPNMDRLATEGARFQYAFSPRGVTLPALTTILTGVSPLAHGVIGNDYALQTQQPTIAEILKENGYATAAFLTNQCTTLVERDDHAGRGFDLKVCAKTASTHQYEWDENATTQALQWLRDAPDGPVFTWVHYMDPHGEHYPRPKLYRGPPADPLLKDQAILLSGHEERGEPPSAEWMDIVWALYDAEVEGVDQCIGTLVEAARARRGDGAAPIVLLTGDHGEEFFQHNAFRGHDASLYDNVLRVPLILVAPDSVPAGIVPKAFAELEDVLPTLLDLVGLAPTVRVQGESLLPLLEKDLERETGFGSAFGVWDPNVLTVRRPQFRYIWNRQPGAQDVGQFEYRKRYDFLSTPELLFDVVKDPGETRNLLAAEDVPGYLIEQRKSLRRQLNDWANHERHLHFELQTIQDERLTEELKQLGYVK